MGPKVLVGIPSRNEKGAPAKLAEALLSRQAGNDLRLVILDESDDPESIHALEYLRERNLPQVKVIARRVRSGKVAGLNSIANEFLAGNYDLLVHFDADLKIDTECLNNLIEYMVQGHDVASAVSISLPGRNMFERALGVLMRPAEDARSRGLFNQPSVGHSGAYTRDGVRVVFPLPENGQNEELIALSRAKLAGLRTGLARTAVVRYRLPDNLDDYLEAHRRVETRARHAINSGSVSDQTLRNRSVPLDGSDVVKSILKDPVASVLTPFLVVARAAGRLTPESPSSPFWRPIRSTKELT
ncbi:MAG: glycosyltransferase [Thermoplasmata archaeon]